jgi:hypothetical protein
MSDNGSESATAASLLVLSTGFAGVRGIGDGVRGGTSSTGAEAIGGGVAKRGAGPGACWTGAVSAWLGMTTYDSERSPAAGDASRVLVMSMLLLVGDWNVHQLRVRTRASV